MKAGRENVGYSIIKASRIDDRHEIVLGVKEKRFGTEFVTWECIDGDSYNWGHYFINEGNAVDDFRERVLKAEKQARRYNQ